MKNVLLAILVLTYLTGFSQERKQPYDDTLKFITWNLHMLPYNIYPKTKKATRAKLIADAMLKSDYNILVFEEAFQIHARRILKSRLKKKYPYIYGPINYKWLSFRVNGGVWILSDRPLIVKGTIQFDVSKGSSKYARKGAILVEGEHRGHLFQIVGTHTAGNPQDVNRHQFSMIYDELLEPYQEDSVPQFICGDMNCQMANTVDYKSMLRIYHAEDTPRNGGYPYSNHTHDKIIDYILLRRNHSSVRQIRKRITLYGPEWKPEKSRIYPESVGLSDHLPVEMWVVFDK